MGREKIYTISKERAPSTYIPTFDYKSVGIGLLGLVGLGLGVALAANQSAKPKFR